MPVGCQKMAVCWSGSSSTATFRARSRGYETVATPGEGARRRPLRLVHAQRDRAARRRFAPVQCHAARADALGESQARARQRRRLAARPRTALSFRPNPPEGVNRRAQASMKRQHQGMCREEVRRSPSRPRSSPTANAPPAKGAARPLHPGRPLLHTKVARGLSPGRSLPQGQDLRRANSLPSSIGQPPMRSGCVHTTVAFWRKDDRNSQLPPVVHPAAPPKAALRLSW